MVSLAVISESVRCSEPSLLNIVNVEIVIHDLVVRDGGSDVILHEFLQLRRQITQSSVALLIVPDDDLRTPTFLGLLLNPFGDFLIRRAGSDKRPEGAIIYPGELQPLLVERAIEWYSLASRGDRRGICPPLGQLTHTRPAFPWATWELFAVPQI